MVVAPEKKEARAPAVKNYSYITVPLQLHYSYTTVTLQLHHGNFRN